MPLDDLDGIANVQFGEVTVTTIGWDTAADWDAAVDEYVVVHEASQTGHPTPGAGTITMGWPTDTIEGFPVSYHSAWGETSGTTLNDNTGNGNDGTINGSPNLTLDPSFQFYGKMGAGFDNTDDYGSVPRNTQTHPGEGTSEDATIISLFATVASITNSDRTYVGQEADNPFDGFYLAGGQNTNGKCSLVLIVNDNVYQHRYDSATSVDDGVWHAMLGRYDYSAGDTYLHLDGAQENSDTGGPQNGEYATGSENPPGPVGIGARPASGTSYWGGRMAYTVVVRGFLSQAQANRWSDPTTGYLETATESFSGAETPNLQNVAHSLNGGGITLDVIGSPGTASEEVVTQVLDGSTSYALTWTSSHTDFRLGINFSLSTLTDTPPEFSGADLVA